MSLYISPLLSELGHERIVLLCWWIYYLLFLEMFLMVTSIYPPVGVDEDTCNS
jgi:hypothetical protein